jgi:hypothetical protein
LVPSAKIWLKAAIVTDKKIPESNKKSVTNVFRYCLNKITVGINEINPIIVMIH